MLHVDFALIPCYNTVTLNNWGIKIRHLREERGLTQEELAAASDVARSHITRMELGTYKSITDEMMRKLAKGLSMTIPELSHAIYGGAGPRGGNPVWVPLGRGQVEVYRLPVHSDYPFHAGNSVDPGEYVYQEMPLGAESHIEAYKVKGTCLAPKINDGDTIIVDRDRAVDNGDIIACMIDGELHLAQLKKFDTELWLETNDGKRKLEECGASAVVIGVVRRLK